jgi:twinkle protein
MRWTNDHFAWIMPSSEDDWTIEKILAAASQLCLRRGIRGLVIDPWNELEALRPSGMTETEFVSQSLKRIRVFARNRDVDAWVVVHPPSSTGMTRAKIRSLLCTTVPAPPIGATRPDKGVVVWGDLSEADSPEVQIHIQRFVFGKSASVARLSSITSRYAQLTVIFNRRHKGGSGRHERAPNPRRKINYLRNH